MISGSFQGFDSMTIRLKTRHHFHTLPLLIPRSRKCRRTSKWIVENGRTRTHLAARYSRHWASPLPELPLGESFASLNFAQRSFRDVEGSR